MRLTRLTAEGSRFSYEHQGRTYVGQRGLFVVGPMAWPTVERWNLDTKLLLGTYACQCAYWTSKIGARRPAIRILLTQDQYERIYSEERRLQLGTSARARGRIYLHPANHPHELEGCIAPGVEEGAHGVLGSVTALGQIFAAIGGWREHKSLPDLEVA